MRNTKWVHGRDRAMRASRTMGWLLIVAAATCLAGCGGDTGGPTPSAAAPPRASPPAQSIPTQAWKHPCEWVQQAEVERTLGPLAGSPRLGRNAETPRPDDQGSACVYPVSLPRGAGEVALQVRISSESAFEQAMGSFASIAREELTGSRRGASAAEARTDGWDYAGNLPNLAVWRLGTLQVEIGGNHFGLPREKLDQLALAVRESVADLPFAEPGADPDARATDPDPCALLTGAEAEGVLGKLVVEPYRAIERSPLVYGAGRSCAYYTAGHHVLVLTPTRQDGKTIFGMAGGVGGLARQVMGGADEGDALDGPWDQATSNVGRLYFLKGDQMLELAYTNSSTDAAGAAKLARAAVPRL